MTLPIKDIDHQMPLYNAFPINLLFKASSCEGRPQMFFDVSHYHPPYCQGQRVHKSSVSLTISIPGDMNMIIFGNFLKHTNIPGGLPV